MFELVPHPYIYCASYDNNSWEEEYIEKKHCRSIEEEEKLPPEERDALRKERNSLARLPFVNYTNQYGLGCFEGLKAFPRKDGNLWLFRPEENARRMERSMRGLLFPVMPADRLEKAILETVRLNRDISYTPSYSSAWENDNFGSAHSVYIRPFTYAESGIGVNVSLNPYLLIVCTTVGSYFRGNEKNAVVTSKRIRATPGGTGSYKATANYTISILAKHEATSAGYMEAIFLDSKEGRFIEEGSSANFFCLLRDQTLVTPALTDTILPGITRQSLLTLARDLGYKTEERDIDLEEVFEEGEECFLSGTASGVTFIGSLTHEGKEKVFGKGKEGPLAKELQRRLKGIQYGILDDPYGWMRPVPSS